MPFVDTLSPRSKIIAAIESNDDVIYVCPKYCLGDQLLLSIMKELKSNTVRCAYLTPKLTSTTRYVDYALLWQSMIQQLGIRNTERPSSSDEFSRCMRKLLGKMTGRVVLFLRVLGVGREAETFQLLYKLNRLGLEYRTPRCSLNFVCLDDFSFWFYERYLSGVQGVQSQIIGQHITYSSISPEETESLVSAGLGDKLGKHEIEKLARVVQELSGGHIGLVGEMCEQARQNPKAVAGDGLSEFLRKAVTQNEIFEGLRRDIEENPIGLTQTALECVEPTVVAENSSPRYRYLRQLGILQVYSPAELVLCPGMIREFVEGLAKARVKSRLGTVATNYGMQIFVDEDPSITDDDFVILHLSDIHVGKDYAYRLSYEGSIHHEGKAALTELIERDLRRMKVTERIDAVVLSGDLVCSGDYDEFNRVGEVVGQLMRSLNIAGDRLLIIPGNHDLKWNPGEFAPPISPGRKVSIEGFQKFLDGLRKEKFLLCAMMPLVSRSGKNRLRIVGIDSNDVEGPEAGGIGYVSKDTLTLAGNLLDSDDIGSFANVATWIVVHHHVLPVTSVAPADAKSKKVSVMGNAQDLMAAASKWRVEAILHGHEHQPSVTWVQRWAGQKFDDAPHGMCVIGAGSCGASRDQLGPISRNQYYLLIRRQQDILIRSRVIGDDGMDFMPHSDIVIRNRNSEP